MITITLTTGAVVKKLFQDPPTIIKGHKGESLLIQPELQQRFPLSIWGCVIKNVEMLGSM